MTLAAPLRIGLVVGSPRVDRHVAGFVDSVCGQLPAHAAVLVTPQDAEGATGGRGMATRVADLVALAWLRAEQALLRIVGAISSGVARRAAGVAVGRVDVARRFERHVTVPGTVGVAASVRDVDVMIVIGTWVPHASQLATGDAEWIQLELGAPAVSGTLLCGFVEAEEGRDGTSIGLYRLDRERGTRACVVDGVNRTRPLFSLNRAAIWGRAVSLAVTCLGSRDGGSLRPRSAGRSAGGRPDDAPPHVARLLAYPARLALRGARMAWGRLRAPMIWRVATVSETAPRADRCRLSYLPDPPAGMWQADPMLYRDPATGRVYCFVEEFDESVGRAHITALEHDGTEWRRVGPALVEPFHLSFPYLFEYEGRLYMVPETCAAKGVFAYRCESLPLRWSRAATLMSGVSATDTMVFERHGRWWMLTNLDRAPVPDHQSELHAFFADSPLSETWVPVAGNPIKVDCDGARNGGLVERDGQWYRFGQVQSFDRYGKQLNVYRIARLDEGGYEEDAVGRIAPPSCQRADGIHTFVTAPGWRAIDLAVPGSISAGRSGTMPCPGAAGCAICADGQVVQRAVDPSSRRPEAKLPAHRE